MGCQATQYERLVEVMAEVKARSRRIVEEAHTRGGSKLVFVCGETSDTSRRAEAFWWQVLQRRHDHETLGRWPS